MRKVYLDSAPVIYLIERTAPFYARLQGLLGASDLLIVSEGVSGHSDSDLVAMQTLVWVENDSSVDINDSSGDINDSSVDINGLFL